LHPETASFSEENAPKPFGYPDIRFSRNTPDFDQYDYDVECKLVRIKRQGKNHDYCKYYVTDGVSRFQDGIYAQSIPPMGTILAMYKKETTWLYWNWSIMQIVLMALLNFNCKKDRLKIWVYVSRNNY
jgi:hypothetical protein